MGRQTSLLYSALGPEAIFFSAADNALPGHVRLDSWAVRRFQHFGLSWLAHRSLEGLISQHGLTRLHVHCGPGGLFLARRPSVPVIATCHHTYWQQSRRLPSQAWKGIFIPFEKRTYRIAETVVCDSEDTRRVLAEQYGIAPRKLLVIPCAVDTSRFRPLGGPRLPHAILCVARLAKRKGIDFLVRSMALVRRSLPQAQLFVAGEGRELRRLRSLARRLGVERNTTFLGFVPDEELNSWYNRARCVVVPSVFEGFGLTVIEAIAAGTRVVATDTDGIRCILKSGEYGTLVPYGDTVALAEAFLRELGSPGVVPELPGEYRLPQFGRRYREVLGLV
jgi:glycosyltransferase involved in cell wall biosynthesis